MLGYDADKMTVELGPYPITFFFLEYKLFFLAGIGFKTGNKLTIYASFAKISSTYARCLFRL